MYKQIALILILSSIQSVNAAIVTVDFLVDSISRYTISDSNWIRDTSYTGQQAFTYSVTFDSSSYEAGPFDYWDGQDVSSYRPEIYSINFGETPFDTELDSIQPVLSYEGGYTPSTISDSSGYGEFAYNGTFDTGTISQNYYFNDGMSYWAERPSDYRQYFERSISLNTRYDDDSMTASDIVEPSLEEYLNLGLGQTFDFTQTVDEYYQEEFLGPWTHLDNGIRYSGSASISNITTVVPVPASILLFFSGLVGLAGFVARKGQSKVSLKGPVTSKNY